MDTDTSAHEYDDESAQSSSMTRLLGGTAFVAIGLALGQATGYLLSLVAARQLGPSVFGAFGALLSLGIVTNVIAVGVQMAGARRLVLEPEAQRRSAARTVLGTASWGAIGIALSILVVSPILGPALKLDGLLPLALLAAMQVPLTFMGGPLGIAQGAESHLRLGLVYAFVGLGRALGGIAALMIAPTLVSSLVGMVLGSFVAAGLSWVTIRALVSSPASGLPGFRAETLHVAHSMFALFLLTNVDMLLARGFLDPHQVGIYAAGAIIAKITFWLPQFVGVVAFPRMADHRRKATTMRAAAAVSAIGVLVTLACAVLPGLFVSIVGGPEYAELTPWVWIFAAAGASLSLAQFLLFARLAVDDRRAVVSVWIGVVALVGAVAMWHPSVPAIASCVLGVGLALAAYGLWALATEDVDVPADPSDPILVSD